MSQIEQTTLGKSCEFFNGKAHEKDIDTDGEYIVVNSKFISQDGRIIKRTKEQMFPLYRDDIVMVMSDVPNGKALSKCFIVDKDDKYSLNQRICCIRSEEFDTKYLYYQLNRNEYFLAFNNGENQTNLRKDDILNCPLIKPSMDDQQNIVSILNEAFEAIDQAKANAEKNLVNAKGLFESYLQGAVENKNEDWEEHILKKVCVFKSGTTIRKDLERSSGDVLYTKVGDMNLLDNEVEIKTSRRFVNMHEININQIIPEGAIIFPKRGGAIATNKKRKIIKPTIVDLNTMAIIPGNKIDNNYFFFWFQLVDLNTLSNGTSIPQINNYSFDNVKISFPKSIEDQQAIVNQLESLKTETQQLETLYQKKIEALDELKKSILQKAFRGELETGKKNEMMPIHL